MCKQHSSWASKPPYRCRFLGWGSLCVIPDREAEFHYKSCPTNGMKLKENEDASSSNKSFGLS